MSGRSGRPSRCFVPECAAEFCTEVCWQVRKYLCSFAPERACYEVIAVYFAILYLNVLLSGPTFAPKCADEFVPESADSFTPVRVDEFWLLSGLTFAPECDDSLYLCVLTSLHLSVSMKFWLLSGRSFATECTDEFAPECAD